MKKVLRPISQPYKSPNDAVDMAAPTTQASSANGLRFLHALTILALVACVGVLTARSVHGVTSAPVPVEVTNAPISITESENPGYIPFSQQLDLTMSEGGGSATLTVPAGKRLVITYVSANISVQSGANVLLDVGTMLNRSEVEAHLPVSPNGVIVGNQIYSCSQTTMMFADPASTVTVAILGSNATSGSAVIGIYGYVVDAK